MAPELSKTQSLKLYEPNVNEYGQIKAAQTPNEWFVQRYPLAFNNHGSPFLDAVEVLDKHTRQTFPCSINLDFFAAVLGGRRDLGHHVIYYEPEMQFYFKDADNIYKSTTQEKLAIQYRAVMMKCAEMMPQHVHKLNLFHEWRSEKVCKAILQRAKSILAADSSFFGVSSPHERIAGPEIHQRIAQVFAQQLLKADQNSILTLSQAYSLFNQFAKTKELPVLKRSQFKSMICEVIKEAYGLGVRNDLMNTETNKQMAGWKGLRAVELAA